LRVLFRGHRDSGEDNLPVHFLFNDTLLDTYVYLGGRVMMLKHECFRDPAQR
jgi:hypothetical protein